MVMKQRRKNTTESRVLGAIMIIKVVEHKDPQLLLIQVEQKGTKDDERAREEASDSPPFSKRRSD
jgi:hypothetical protein